MLLTPIVASLRKEARERNKKLQTLLNAFNPFFLPSIISPSRHTLVDE